MRSAPTILHLDMDAFYASVEQASKPSLRGKAVIVGGLGPRGVVATASYEARRFGVHSAMPMAQARRLCPNGACLIPRFSLYREVSDTVMGMLRELSPLVEPLSLDEAFVDLEAGGVAFDAEAARAVGERLRADITAVTGLSGSVGLAGSKMLAKVASEEAKPAGLLLIEVGTERAHLAPMSVRTLPGVGPATGEHLRRAGITTVGELAEAGEDELVRMVGRSHGVGLYRMALGVDERPVVAERDAKSVSVEDTFDVDLHDRVRIRTEVQRLADRCVERLRGSGHSGRTIVLKVRRYDFSTLTRSETLRGPTDDPAVVREAAARLLEAVDTTGGVRLLGVGVTGLADYTQEDLFAFADAMAARAGADGDAGPAAGEGADRTDGVAPSGGGAVDADGGQESHARGEGAGQGPGPGRDEGTGQGRGARQGRGEAPGDGQVEAAGQGLGAGEGRVEAAGLDAGEALAAREGRAQGQESGQAGGPGRSGGVEGVGERSWPAGSDVRHVVYGPGWVQGSGVGRVTVRFEQPGSEPGRVRTFLVDDPELEPSDPMPLVGDQAVGVGGSTAP
ncbi:DNA polymerase IV [Streptomyces sp. NBC_00193]|uniref:DNA polymerase IV n=1 Tax=unclassified Streptomyces TaxID=2593676 RepID=UPI002251D4C7|nr:MULTISPECIES: DNA polymerase IV [unclassified Streptomyces]MCX5126107.1 DNA polymerase IV [Streptomyces sp. NBC_00347]MCX5299736.1 DNA polymerase IV [Streptomyces sp. NBC_00193]